MEARSEKEIKRRLLRSTMSTKNIKRTTWMSVLSAAFVPIILVILAETGYREIVDAVSVSAIFYAFVSVVVASLCFFVQRSNIRKAYVYISYGYVAVNLIWMCAFARTMFVRYEDISFFYVAVLFSALTIYLSFEMYLAVVLLQFAGFMWIIKAKGALPISTPQMIIVGLVVVFAFLLSREVYGNCARYIKAERRLLNKVSEAETDPLTQLRNRRGLDRVVKSVWNECVGGHLRVAVIMLDIDKFKVYNDTFGHAQGDTCLKLVSDSLKNTIKDDGFVSRVGGEEFLIFLYDISESTALEIAENVRSDVEAMGIEHATAKGAVVTISVGLYTEKITEKTQFENLYKKADTYLYKAKETGRNKVVSNVRYRRKTSTQKKEA